MVEQQVLVIKYHEYLNTLGRTLSLEWDEDEEEEVHFAIETGICLMSVAMWT